MDEKNEMRIELPLTDLQPGSHRCLVVSHVMEEKRASSGLVLPTQSLVKDKNKNDMLIVEYRYFVVAVSPDFNVKTQEGVPLEIGDEVYPLVFDGTTNINLPCVKDYARDMFTYHVLHDSEIMAFRKSTGIIKPNSE